MAALCSRINAKNSAHASGSGVQLGVLVVTAICRSRVQGKSYPNQQGRWLKYNDQTVTGLSALKKNCARSVPVFKVKIAVGNLHSSGAQWSTTTLSARQTS